MQIASKVVIELSSKSQFLPSLNIFKALHNFIIDSQHMLRLCRLGLVLVPGVPHVMNIKVVFFWQGIKSLNYRRSCNLNLT